MDNRQAALELGTKPVGKLLTQYALPAIVAMTASSLYNIIDRAFIGQIVGPEAIAGLGITFPFMNLSAAFGAAVGVGASTCISVKLGQHDYKRAEQLLGNTVTLNLIVGFLFMVICLLFLDPILRFFGASEVTLPYAREFMIVILLGNMVTHMYFGMNAVLRAAGKPRHAMYATLFTVACNIVLVITFVWWFRWGIRGAALTVGQERAVAPETGYLPFASCPGEEYHSHWHITVLNECLLVHHRHFHEQSVRSLWWRYGGGCLFDSELGGHDVLYVCYGYEPRYAAYCGLQLWRRTIRPHVSLSVADHCCGNGYLVGWLDVVDVVPTADSPHLYH